MKNNNMQFDIEKFSPKESQLETLVAVTKNITATDLEDKDQLDKVKENRKALSQARINITKTGKELRQGAIDFQKAVLGREKELLGIITPEEDRLKAIEKEAKDLALKKERMVALPERKNRLNSIDDGFEVTDECLLSLDDTQFENYYNQRVADKNQADLDKIEKEKAKLKRQEDDKKLLEQEEERKKEQQLNSRISRLTALGFVKVEGEITNFIFDKYPEKKVGVTLNVIKEQTEEQFTRFVVDVEQFIEKKKEEERQAEVEKQRLADEKYQNWLSENGYEAGTREFVIQGNGDEVLLYKLVSVYKK